MPVDLPQSVSISGAEINLTFRAVSTCVLCCNLAESKSVSVFSLVGYDGSCLAAIRHVKSIVRVIQPRPNIRSHSVLLFEYNKLYVFVLVRRLSI